MTKKTLIERESDGVKVEVVATFNGSSVEDISCHVLDARHGEYFVISDIPHNRVLEVFNHPFSVGVSLLMKGTIS
jgi:hypothetical protein